MAASSKESVVLDTQSTNTGSKYTPTARNCRRYVCTVFQAEILGIRIACEQLLNNFDTYTPKYIEIFSDSQAAILAVDNLERTSQLVRETKFILNKLAVKVLRLMVVWIKAHVGHEGNEEADRMAKLGTTNSDKHLSLIHI